MNYPRPLVRTRAWAGARRTSRKRRLLAPSCSLLLEAVAPVGAAIVLHPARRSSIVHVVGTCGRALSCLGSGRQQDALAAITPSGAATAASKSALSKGTSMMRCTTSGRCARPSPAARRACEQAAPIKDGDIGSPEVEDQTLGLRLVGPVVASASRRGACSGRPLRACSASRRRRGCLPACCFSTKAGARRVTPVRVARTRRRDLKQGIGALWSTGSSGTRRAGDAAAPENARVSGSVVLLLLGSARAL
jgi:hypothetical protein